ncbi:DUF4258 domain-containing protein [Candidatus Bathyarchaeota archaeon]|nr:DUF4258 domain-containing protein [Candidatus Bathyarchaeota archaeon]
MGYKGRRVIYATHALKRAKQRGISRQDILDVLEAADVEYPSKTYPGRRVLRKRFSKSYEVGVVIVPPSDDHDKVGVITAWANRES